jgi:uncharacterized protein (DUF2141 family)
MRMAHMLALGASLLGATARAATVEIVIDGVRNDRGHVLVALCSKQDFLQPRCPLHGSAKAVAGRVRISISGVAPGTYAAEAYHDENDNMRLDRNFFGFPREGMGFSNDAKMRMGPPSFEDAAVRVGGGDLEIGFRIRYF